MNKEPKIVKFNIEIIQELGKDEVDLKIKVDNPLGVSQKDIEGLYIYEVVKAAVDGIGQVTGSYDVKSGG